MLSGSSGLRPALCTRVKAPRLLGKWGISLAPLIPGMVPVFVVMAVIIVALSNAIRPALVIARTMPFALICITATLLPTQVPFGFLPVA